jgi:Leucine-rich repeat (LRR) protein
MNQYRVSYKTHEELLFGCGVFINEPNPLLTDITINYILPLLEPLLEKEVVDLNICIANAGHLSVCPRSLGMLQNLKVLNFYGANFKTLPESIGLLSKLVCLELCHSKISELPNSFNNLKQLRRLDLTNNQFQTLPPCISSFKNLHTLILFGTPITELSDDLILELPKECTIFMKESVQISQSFCEHFVVKHNYN